jgi:hypothetical protein
LYCVLLFALSCYVSSCSVTEAASKNRGVGRLPLHYAVFYDQPSVAVVEYLLEVFRQGAEVPDVYGRLPLHYAGNTTMYMYVDIIEII